MKEWVMRWVVLVAGVLCGALWGVGCGGDAGEGEGGVRPAVDAPSKGRRLPAVTIVEEEASSILLEAEGGEVKEPVKVFAGEGASGGKYALAPEGPEHKEISIGGHVTYRFAAAKAGRYTLWLRANFSGACGNSLGVMLDGQSLGVVEDAVYERWHWVPLRGTRMELSAGPHVLVVSNREDGAGWDQVLLAGDEEYRPGDIEKAEVAGRTTGGGRDAVVSGD